jgi:hypothetical protein
MTRHGDRREDSNVLGLTADGDKAQTSPRVDPRRVGLDKAKVKSL